MTSLESLIPSSKARTTPSIHVVLLLQFLILRIALVKSSSSLTQFRTPSGICVNIIQPVLINDRIHLQPKYFKRAIYELSENHPRLLLNHIYPSINISSVAPLEEYLHWDKNLKYTHFERFAKVPDSVSVIRTGISHTFLFDGDYLIVGWGPRLQLRRISSRLFINDNFDADSIINNKTRKFHENEEKPIAGIHELKILPSLESNNESENLDQESESINTTKETDGIPPKADHYERKSKQCNSSNILTLEIAIAYDKSFCKLYSNSYQIASSVIRTLVYKVSRILPCIRLRLLSIDASCKSDTNLQSGIDPFKRPSLTLESCSQQPSCDPTRSLLKSFASSWSQGVSGNAPRDIAFVFTGYGINNSSVNEGGTFQSSVCSFNHGIAWVKGANPYVFAHEIGHVLSASHSSSGIMNPFKVEEELLFSKDSLKSIVDFVNLDSKSWCLRRNYNNFATLQKKYHWSTPTFITTDPNDDINISSVTIQKNNIYMLVYVKSKKQLSFAVITNVHCKNQVCGIDGKIRHSKYSIDLLFPDGAFEFSFTFLNNDDILISYITANGNNIIYNYGYGFNSKTLQLSRWNKKKSQIPSSKKILAASISTYNSSLITIQAERDEKDGNTGIFYRISSKLNKGKKYGVPGYFGRNTTSVSTSIIDLNKNGKPEIVVFYADDSDGLKSGYIRIGRDVDIDSGRVTDGWSAFVKIPVLLPSSARIAGSMTTFSNNIPALIVLQRERAPFFPVWDLFIGSKVLTPKVISSIAKRSYGTETRASNFACYKCFKNMHIEECKNKIKECNTLDLKSKNVSLEVKNNYNSLYCIGIQAVVIENGWCALALPINVVLTKGLQVAFIKVLQEQDDSENVNEFVITKNDLDDEFEVMSVGGLIRPSVAAYFVIEDKNVSYRTVLRKALKELKVLSGFGKDSFQTKIVRRKNRWTISIFLKEIEDF